MKRMFYPGCHDVARMWPEPRSSTRARATTWTSALKLAALAVGLTTGLGGCAPRNPIFVPPVVVNPVVVARHRFPAQIDLVVEGMGEGDTCSTPEPALRPVCVSNLRGDFGAALRTIIAQFTSPDLGHPPTYQAEFRMVELVRSPLIGLAMEWKFSLRDERGRSLVALDEVSRSPGSPGTMDDMSWSMRGLEQAVLEAIGVALDDAANPP